MNVINHAFVYGDCHGTSMAYMFVYSGGFQFPFTAAKEANAKATNANLTMIGGCGVLVECFGLQFERVI